MQKSFRNLVYSIFVGGAGLSTLPLCASVLMTPNLWVARFSMLKGDVTCKYGDADCNRCAKNVEANFVDIGKGRVFNYDYELRDKYKPSGLEPKDYLTRGPDGGTHLQSFVRIPLDKAAGSNAWFAGTYGGPDATVFVVSMPAEGSGGAVEGDGRLKYLYRAEGDHPGGAQALGHNLLIGRSAGEKGYVDIYDLSAPGAGTVKTVAVGYKNSSVAAAKLAGGGYLILSKDSGKNGNYAPFYTSSLTSGNWEALPKIQAGNGVENISLVTECGTQKIFLITATANGATDTKNPIYDDNIYRLYSLNFAGGKPGLAFENETSDTQSIACDGRASATHFVDGQGNLRRYCSQKLGTKSREAARTCFVPTVPNFSQCKGSFLDKLTDWDCYKNAIKVVVPGLPTGVDCLDFVKLDDHMSFTEK